MKKRALCFLTAAVLLLLLPCASPADGCDHVTRPSEWILQGYVDPQPGVPGYSGDFCCPICGAVKKKGQPIAALDIEDPEPDAPAEPDPPAEPAAPAEPETPAEPEAPVEPVQPENPEQPETPEQPTEPESPVQPTEPEQPVIPAQPETPVQPAEPESPPLPETPAEAELPPVVPEPPAEESAPAADPASDPADSSGTGNPPRKEPAPKERKRFSDLYPYRRVKMNPEPGLRAEAAGILLWPAAGSPLQQMLNK